MGGDPIVTRVEHVAPVCSWAGCPILGTTREEGYLFCAKHLVEHRMLFPKSKPAPEPKPRRNLLPCGTPAAYDRHLKHRELPCDPCVEAKRAKNRAKEQARKRRAA